MNILVTGGAGYIGSHAVRLLKNKKYKVVVLDNLSNGHREALPEDVPFIKGCIADEALVKQVLKEYQITGVMNFAAFIEVGESVADPYKYYQNNFSRSLSLLRTLVQNDVKKFVFSSTAAVYGNPTTVPIPEDHIKNPLNPYGQSKLMVEQALADFSKAHGLGYAVLRYFNVAGAHPDGGIGEDHSPESHLIPRILLAAMDKTVTLPIYGTDYPTNDGTCVRDYIHVHDLVQAHVLALENIEAGRGQTYNLGSEKGYSVLEVIQACREVTGTEIKVETHPRRAGDSAVLVASSQKIKSELGWTPEYQNLKTIIQHAWQWHTSHPKGYQSPKDH